ncbi:MAG: hypothetical protein JWP91_531 [Fibrobacteres bacterium]|nr:hypothetical protein [Fibrobacterota bacterium]
MTEDKDLVHILKLLDDESAKVRTRVWEKLEANLPAWEAGIRARLDEVPSAPRRKLLDLLSGRARKGFRGSWLRWRDLASDMERLEAALSGLSWYLAEGKEDWHGGADAPPRHPALGPLLDGLAMEFRQWGGPMSPTSLALFLFTDKGLKGADNDYYNPGNSDLVQVIEKGQGIPITLACVFMLVGHRLGFDISGCDVPEHFLTRAVEDGKDIIIDCFDGGKALEPEKLAQLELKYAPEFSKLLKSTARPEAIVARVLRNLINAYHLAGNRQASQFMWSLAEDLRGEREGDLEIGEDPGADAPGP